MGLCMYLHKNANHRPIAGLSLENIRPWPWPRTCCPRTHPCILQASLAVYRQVFCTHFNLGFGSPKSDTCCKCEASNSVDIARHKELAEVALQQQQQDREQARTNSNVMYITFDLEKTLPLPKLSVSKAFYMKQLWVNNFDFSVCAPYCVSHTVLAVMLFC